MVLELAFSYAGGVKMLSEFCDSVSMAHSRLNESQAEQESAPKYI